MDPLDKKGEDKQEQVVKKSTNWPIIVLSIIGLIFLTHLLQKPSNVNNKTQIETTVNVTEGKVNFSAEKETEIYYRYDEIYHDITEKEGLDPLPKVGEKNYSSPKRNKAEQTTANEFNISISTLKNILDKVSKTKPSVEELRIYQLVEDRTNKAIDTEASGGELINEDKIDQEIANSLGISQQKLNAIWLRVFMWKQNE